MFVTFARQNKNIDEKNMLATCTVTFCELQNPSNSSQQCPTTRVQLTFWQTGHKGIYYITLIDVFG